MRNKKCIIIGITGLAIGYATVWIGTYVLHNLDNNDWRAFPIFLTLLLPALLSLICLSHTFMNWDNS